MKIKINFKLHAASVLLLRVSMRVCACVCADDRDFHALGGEAVEGDAIIDDDPNQKWAPLIRPARV